MRTLVLAACAIIAPLFQTSPGGSPALPPVERIVEVPRTARSDGWFVPTKGCRAEVVTGDPAEGETCVRLFRAPEEGDGDDAPFGNFMHHIDAAPYRGKVVRLQARMRCDGASEAGRGQMWLRVDLPGSQIGFFDNMDDRPVGGSAWTQVSIEGPVAPDARYLALGFMLIDGESIRIDSASLDTVGDIDPTATPASYRGNLRLEPGLFRMRGESSIQRNADLFKPTEPLATLHVLMPVPLSYREQVPLSYELIVEPRSSLISARIVEDRPGNFVADVILGGLEEGAKVRLGWSALVLCAPRSFDDVPRAAPLPQAWPQEALPWLRSTRAAQSADARVLAVAREIRGEDLDVLTIIRSTLDRMRTIFEGQEGRSMRLDAVEALERVGSCTSRANLCAALLRANGIPARILAGYPSWSGPLQTHYTVEAFVPEYGWYPIESTMLSAPWPPTGQLQVAIVPPEYEDRSSMRFWAADGVPYLSMTERAAVNGNFVVKPDGLGKTGCDHVAERTATLDPLTAHPDWDEALHLARERWTSWIRAQSASIADLSPPEGVEGRTTGQVRDITGSLRASTSR